MTANLPVHVPDDVLYRYEETLIGFGVDEYDEPLPGHTVEVSPETFKVLRRTPKGAWIECYYVRGMKKFVLLTAKKQFASNTLDEALTCFVKRKEAQIRILTARIKDAKEALRKVSVGDYHKRSYWP